MLQAEYYEQNYNSLIPNNINMGVSEEAKEIDKSICEIIPYEPYKFIQNQIDEFLIYCKTSNWDSYGANPVKEASIIEAKKLADVLIKNDMPLPDLLPEPSGNMGMEWFGNGYNILLTIENNWAYYGGINPQGNRIYGDFEIIKNLDEDFKSILNKIK